MNDLRFILLLIGIALIALIYIWEILKQKRNRRARIENVHVPVRNADAVPRTASDTTADTVTGRELADFSLLLHQDEKALQVKADDIGKLAPNRVDKEFLRHKPQRSEGEGKTGHGAPREILVIYITAGKQPFFQGVDILKAVEDADMHYGDMHIFHNYGPDRKHAKRPLYSLANINEPGYFDMEDMKTFTTRGLALFMCLPAEIGGDIAFEFMLDTAYSLARALGGELRSVERKPLDDDAINKLRAIASLF